MGDEEHFRIVFIDRLAYYMRRDGKNQMDLMRDLRLSSSTVSSWCTGKKLPRMNKMQKLANYFGVEISDLIEEKSTGSRNNKDVFYLDEEEQVILDLFQHLNERGRKQLLARARELIRLGFATVTDLPESIAADLAKHAQEDTGSDQPLPG